MFRVSAIVAIALAATSSVLAQDLAPCVLSCTATLAPEYGCAFTDLACLCGSTAFQEADLACLQRDCTADELADAIAFSAEQCGATTETDTATDTDTETDTETGTGTTRSVTRTTPTPTTHATSTTPRTSTSATSTSSTAAGFINTAGAGAIAALFGVSVALF